MVVSENGVPSISENGVGGYDGNVFMELPENDIFGSGSSDSIEILVENTTSIVEYLGEYDKKISNIEQASIFILVACGLVFGGICALILDSHLSSGVK